MQFRKRAKSSVIDPIDLIRVQEIPIRSGMSLFFKNPSNRWISFDRVYSSVYIWNISNGMSNDISLNPIQNYFPYIKINLLVRGDHCVGYCLSQNHELFITSTMVSLNNLVICFLNRRKRKELTLYLNCFSQTIPINIGYTRFSPI